MLDVQGFRAGNGHGAAPDAEHSGAAVEGAVYVHGDISFHNDAGFAVVVPHLGDGAAQQVHGHVSVDHAAVGNVVDDLHITALHGEGDVVDAVGLGVAAHGHVAGNGGILVYGQVGIACGLAVAAQIDLVVCAAFQKHGAVGSLVGIQFAAEDFQSACAGSYHAVGHMEFRPGVNELGGVGFGGFHVENQGIHGHVAAGGKALLFAHPGEPCAGVPVVHAVIAGGQGHRAGDVQAFQVQGGGHADLAGQDHRAAHGAFQGFQGFRQGGKGRFGGLAVAGGTPGPVHEGHGKIPLVLLAIVDGAGIVQCHAVGRSGGFVFVGFQPDFAARLHGEGLAGKGSVINGIGLSGYMDFVKIGAGAAGQGALQVHEIQDPLAGGGFGPGAEGRRQGGKTAVEVHGDVAHGGGLSVLPGRIGDGPRFQVYGHVAGGAGGVGGIVQDLDAAALHGEVQVSGNRGGLGGGVGAKGHVAGDFRGAADGQVNIAGGGTGVAAHEEGVVSTAEAVDLHVPGAVGVRAEHFQSAGAGDVHVLAQGQVCAGVQEQRFAVCTGGFLDGQVFQNRGAAEGQRGGVAGEDQSALFRAGDGHGAGDGGTGSVKAAALHRSAQDQLAACGLVQQGVALGEGLDGGLRGQAVAGGDCGAVNVERVAGRFLGGDGEGAGQKRQGQQQCRHQRQNTPGQPLGFGCVLHGDSP